MNDSEMRKAKQELHRLIIDKIIGFSPNDKEFEELLDYVEKLAKIEKSIDK